MRASSGAKSARHKDANMKMLLAFCGQCVSVIEEGARERERGEGFGVARAITFFFLCQPPKPLLRRFPSKRHANGNEINGSSGLLRLAQERKELAAELAPHIPKENMFPGSLPPPSQSSH